MYYHSTDWGFDDNYQTKKKTSRSGLKAIGLPMLESISCSYYELVQNKVRFKPNGVYLVTADDGTKEKNRKGYFGVKSSDELLQHIIRDFGDSESSLSACKCHCIEQLFPCEGCFTGALFSNGCGDLVCETINNTVDNREVTSGSSAPYERNRIIYHDGELSFCGDYFIWATLLSVISLCINNKGYYEFAFGLVSGKKGLYFSYFSSEEIYQNIFPLSAPFDDDYIRCKCIESCYLQYLGIEKI